MAYKGKVLIIDDEPDLLELVSLSLSRAGYTTTKACSGEEGVALARGGGFDLVIMDIMMPGMGGIAALKEIKKLAPGTEVVMLTAHGSLDTAVESMRLGTFDYLKKPFNITELEAVAGKAVEKRRLAEVARAALSEGAPNGLMPTIMASALALLGADEVLVLLDKGGDGRRVASYAGFAGQAAVEERLLFCTRCFTMLCEAGGEPLILTPLTDPRLMDLPGATGVGAGILIPLAQGGMLGAFRRAGGFHFGEAELRRANNLGSIVSLAVRNSELNAQIRAVRLQLAGMQKMESIGMLAGQISHDFNNLLGVIMGSVQLLIENLRPGENMTLSGEILRMAREADALVRQLLLFARGGGEEVAPLDLNGCVDEVKLIISKIAGAQVHVEYLQDRAIPKVAIRREHFKQVALNLASNAKKATRGGNITISTRLAAPGDGLPAGAAAGKYIVFQVEDEGEGISPENLVRIFEPFFTTRPPGSGTGLGLHIARSLLREYGGEINAANRPGGGAVFRVLLPAAA